MTLLTKTSGIRDRRPVQSSKKKIFHWKVLYYNQMEPVCCVDGVDGGRYWAVESKLVVDQYSNLLPVSQTDVSFSWSHFVFGRLYEAKP